MSKGAQSAGRPEAVAGEAARSPVADPGPADDAPQPTASDTNHCADCGSDKVVYVTDDPAAEQKGYCAKHKPANVTDKMVEEQGRT